MTLIETQPLLRSARLLGVALALILAGLLLAISFLILWLGLDVQGTGQSLAASVGYGEADLNRGQSYGLAGIVLIQLAIWCLVVWRARQIFAALVDQDVEGASIAASQTARMLWIMLAWSVAAHMLGTLITTWHFPEGERAISLTIGSAEISTIFAALLATFTSQAFVLGAELWQDHREVI